MLITHTVRPKSRSPGTVVDTQSGGAAGHEPRNHTDVDCPSRDPEYYLVLLSAEM